MGGAYSTNDSEEMQENVQLGNTKERMQVSFQIHMCRWKNANKMNHSRIRL